MTAAEGEMGDEDHEPGEKRTESGDGEDESESGCGVKRVEHCGDCNAGRGNEERRDGHAGAGEPSKKRWGIAGASEREHHAAGDVELTVHGGERRDEHDRVENAGGIADVRDLHDADEGAG